MVINCVLEGLQYLQKLWVLDEFEVDAGLVTGAQAVGRHVHDGGGLPDGAAVHHGLVPVKMQSQWRLIKCRTVISPPYLVAMVVGWCSTMMSPSNSQQDCGFSFGETITIPVIMKCRSQ